MKRILILSIALAIAKPAAADPKQDHLARADAAYKAGNYKQALESLMLAYALDPDRQVIFAIGQVHMKLGDCKQAIAFYERFLATTPDASDAAVATKAIAHCKTEKPEVVVPPKPVVAPVVIEPPKPPPPPEHIAWYRDWLGDVLVLGGVAAGAVGAIEYRSAVDRRDRADHAASYRDYSTELDASHRAQRLSIGLVGGGSLLIVAGIVRYAVRDSTRERAAVSVVPTHGGAFAAWSAPF